LYKTLAGVFEKSKPLGAMENIQNPYWYKLTKLLKQKGKIDTGLTIPYLFGAYELLGKSPKDVSSIINEIRKYSIDKYPVVQKCGTIHQHVIAVEDKKIYNNAYIKDIKLRKTNEQVDLIVSTNTNLGKTEQEVYKNLTQLYDEPIKAKTFSWNNKEGKWKPFEKDEIDLIMSIQ